MGVCCSIGFDDKANISMAFYENMKPSSIYLVDHKEDILNEVPADSDDDDTCQI